MTGKELRLINLIALREKEFPIDYKVLVNCGIIQDNKFENNEQDIVDILLKSNDGALKHLGKIIRKYQINYKREKESNEYYAKTFFNIYNILSEYGGNTNEKSEKDNLAEAVENELKYLNESLRKSDSNVSRLTYDLYEQKDKNKSNSETRDYFKYLNHFFDIVKIKKINPLPKDLTTKGKGFSVSNWKHLLNKDKYFINLLLKNLDIKINKIRKNKKLKDIYIEIQITLNRKWENMKTKSEKSDNENIFEGIDDNKLSELCDDEQIEKIKRIKK